MEVSLAGAENKLGHLFLTKNKEMTAVKTNEVINFDILLYFIIS